MQREGEIESEKIEDERDKVVGQRMKINKWERKDVPEIENSRLLKVV